MALEFKTLVSDLDQILGIDAVMSYLNRDENRSYHYYIFERTILAAFNGGLRPYITQVADFEATWTDLGRLLRVAVKGKLGEADGERLNKYCSHSDYGKLNSTKDAWLECTQVSDGEAGKQQLVHDIWNGFNIIFFSHVYDVLMGKLDLRVCARGQTYCYDLYLIRKNPGTAQKYCSVKCRDAESQRQVRIRRKEQSEEIRV